MLPQLFITAFRNIRKNKAYSFLNIFGLGAGIACAGLIGIWIESETGFDRMHAKADRLYQVKVNMKLGEDVLTMHSTPRPMAAAIKSELPGIVHAARFSDSEQRLPITVSDRSVFTSGRYADADFFKMFTFTFLQGNAAQPFPQLYSIVITNRFARKVFGKEDELIGKTITINNNQVYTVSAVINDLPENSTLQFEWLASYDILTHANNGKDAVNDATDWSSYGPITFVELDKNADPDRINTQLRPLIKGKASEQKKEAFLFPLTKLHLYNEFSDGHPTGSGRIVQVKMFAAIACIILLIACINFMNLATAGAQKRAREVGVRKVLGAGRGKLILQFLSEAILMSFLGMFLGTVLISIFLPAFNLLTGKNLVPGFTNPFHISLLLGIALICGFIAGIYPAIYLSSFKPAGILKGLRAKTGGAPYIRKGLVVIQFVVSVVFIISTITVFRQIQFIKNRNLGFNRENLMEIKAGQDITRNFAVVRQRLLETGVVADAALAGHATLKGGNTDNGFTWAGKPTDQKVSIAHRNVSAEYTTVSGMVLSAGRNFISNAAAENSNIIINESMARLMGNGPAIGQVIRSPRDNEKGVLSDMTIVGVVKDFVYGDIFGKAAPLIMFCKAPKNQGFIYLRTKPQVRIDMAVASIEKIMKDVNPGYPVEYSFVDDQFDELYKSETLLGKISGTFATLAILISCLGLFGLAAYTAERRTKEIGVRKVLGATVRSVTILVSREFLQLVLVSCLVAFPLAWMLMQNWLQSYEYRIGISWTIFVGAGFIAFLIALFTVSFHSIRSALANPVDSLRNE